MKRNRKIRNLILEIGLVLSMLLQMNINSFASGIGTENAVTASEENAEGNKESSAAADDEDAELAAYLEEAKDALSEVTKQEVVLALVYLSDTYDVKKAPGNDQETCVQVKSGTSVKIIGMALDAEYNLWYQVEILEGDNTQSGYIDRNYLAYSNASFLEWENNYFTKPATLTTETGYVDVQQFPEAYRGKLTALKQLHPNWIFVKQDTGLDWNSVIANENKGEKNLVYKTLGDAYKNGLHSPNWYYASKEAVEYYMDPRNFLEETRIFQFEQLTFNASYHSLSAVENILNGTFMKGMIPDGDTTYASAFYTIGATLKVSPFHLACRVYQEQGQGTSALISGTYAGYEGYYNYYNIGASGTTTKQIVESGLKKAKEYGWDSRYSALQGGALIVSKNYILKGQDTLYLQKFNVAVPAFYDHQYMQNISAPYTEAQMVRNAYKSTGSLDNPFVFKIPVYQNMPSSACPVPGTAATPTPTVRPTAAPTVRPTAEPTAKPTAEPTAKPTAVPTAKPTAAPTVKPAEGGTATAAPTVRPTAEPTAKPTAAPTAKPTAAPTVKPAEGGTATAAPTEKPTAAPTAKPTVKPAEGGTATAAPTEKPTAEPTAKPTAEPTIKPSEGGTATAAPTERPAAASTAKPTAESTAKPTAAPTAKPTAEPTAKPTAAPTEKPTAVSTAKPTAEPTAKPTAAPTAKPTAAPTAKPTAAPTAKPTAAPTEKPTAEPTAKPTAAPTAKPTAAPTEKPTAEPTAKPTAAPTEKPTAEPTAKPTAAPATEALTKPEVEAIPEATSQPTQQPTQVPASLTDVTQGTTSDGVVIAAATPKPEKAADTKPVVHMDMSKSTTLYGETLAQMKEQNMEVVLEMSDGVTWTIDSSSIDTDAIKDINLKVTVGKSNIPRELLDALTEEEQFTELSLAHDGEFGFTAEMSIRLDAEEGQYANLFYYNEATGEFEFVCAAIIDANNTAIFKFGHASDYVVIISDRTCEELLTQKAERIEEAEEIVEISLSVPEEVKPAEEPEKAIGTIVVILIVCIVVVLGILIFLLGKNED